MRAFPSDLPLTAPSSVSRRRTGTAGGSAALVGRLSRGLFRACIRSACILFACMRLAVALRALCRAGHRNVLQTGHSAAFSAKWHFCSSFALSCASLSHVVPACSRLRDARRRSLVARISGSERQTPSGRTRDHRVRDRRSRSYAHG